MELWHSQLGEHLMLISYTYIILWQPAEDLCQVMKTIVSKMNSSNVILCMLIMRWRNYVLNI